MPHICIYFPSQDFNSILSICLYYLVGRAHSRVKSLFLAGAIYSSQGHWHCSSVIPLPALYGGIFPVALQSLCFLLTEWFLFLAFCASQGARGRCLDSTHLCIAAAPNTHSFHGPRRPSKENAPNGPLGPTSYLIKILILWSCQWKYVRHCEWCVKVTQLCPTLAHINWVLTVEQTSLWLWTQLCKMMSSRKVCLCLDSWQPTTEGRFFWNSPWTELGDQAQWSWPCSCSNQKGEDKLEALFNT